jgi:hypothetical protein
MLSVALTKPAIQLSVDSVASRLLPVQPFAVTLNFVVVILAFDSSLITAAVVKILL